MSRSYSVSAGLPIEQPPGEDYFLANVRIDTPDDLRWDDGFSIAGSWKIISRTLSQYLAFDPKAGRSTVRIYQGEEARRRFVEGIQEEIRYQAEKRAQLNN